MSARLVVLASGAGTTLQAILDATASPQFGAQVVAVGSDVPGCAALSRARTANTPTFVVPLAEFPDRSAWNAALADRIAAYEPDLVVLAGFMRVLGADVVKQFPIINTHPSLLPAFAGAHAVRDALAHGVKVTGVTIHWVDEGLDSGTILAQVPVRVEPTDDEVSLRERVQAAEKPLYIKVIRQLCEKIGSK